MKIVYEDVFGTQLPLILDVHGTMQEKNHHNKTKKNCWFSPCGYVDDEHNWYLMHAQLVKTFKVCSKSHYVHWNWLKKFIFDCRGIHFAARCMYIRYNAIWLAHVVDVCFISLYIIHCFEIDYINSNRLCDWCNLYLSLVMRRMVNHIICIVRIKQVWYNFCVTHNIITIIMDLVDRTPLPPYGPSSDDLPYYIPWCDDNKFTESIRRIADKTYDISSILHHILPHPPLSLHRATTVRARKPKQIVIRIIIYAINPNI